MADRIQHEPKYFKVQTKRSIETVKNQPKHSVNTTKKQTVKVITQTISCDECFAEGYECGEEYTDKQIRNPSVKAKIILKHLNNVAVMRRYAGPLVRIIDIRDGNFHVCVRCIYNSTQKKYNVKK